MYAALLSAAVTVQPVPASVAIEEAERFGVDAQTCYRLWILARDEMWRMRPVVQANNPPRMVAAWEEEAKWRRDCWDELDYVLRACRCESQRLNHLNRLRELLGDVDFLAGRMPLPCPDYRR